MGKFSTHRVQPARQVVCTHCSQPSEVARRAMSVFCPHCHKRLILEDYSIRSYHSVGEFFTCGDIVVERNGHVFAPIRAKNLTVKGSVQGRIEARGTVKVCKTGSLKGDIDAQRLAVEDGAVLNGFVRVGM